nr:sensory transduction protein [Kurthia massiliensis]
MAERILIIEDEQNIARVLELELQFEGIHALSGEILSMTWDD